MATSTSRLYFGLSKNSIIILIIVFILFFYVAYLFLLPYKAERHFRDGYNNTVLKRYSIAIDHLLLAQKYAPWETHYQIQLSRTYEEYAAQQPSTRLKMAYYNKIESLYINMMKLDRFSPWINSRLSSLYLTMMALDNQKNYKEMALNNAKIAAEKDSQNPLFQLNYASFLHREGQLDAAKPFYLKTIDYDPRMSEAHYNLANIYQQEGQLDKSLDQYLTLYKITPKFPNIELAIANAYIQLKQPKEAITYLEKAIEKKIDKNSLKVLTNLYLQTKQWNKAVIFYRQYFDTFGLSEALHAYYVQALIQTNTKENIVEAYQSLIIFLKQFPNNTLAKKQLSQIKPYIKVQ